MCTEHLETENLSGKPIFGKKENRCIVFSADSVLVAEAIEKRNRIWSVRTKVACNFVIQIDDTSFHLHKVPMASKSEYINRLMSQRRSTGETSSCIRIDNFPGGHNIFEMVVKFCYGMRVELTAPNIAPLYSAANFMEMTEDLEHGNLISKTESFLSFIIFASWKDTFCILRSCETISSWARELGIVKRCSESIAWKASIGSNITYGDNEMQYFEFFGRGHSSNVKSLPEHWWFNDLLFLRIDHFIEVIASCKKNGIRLELVGTCIAQWTIKWLSRISLEFDDATHKYLTIRLYKITIESLITVLPEEENSVSCNFALHLFKLGLTVGVDCELLKKLERRIASMLVSCRAKDLLVKNYGGGTSVYDVGIVVRVVQAYVSLFADKFPQNLHIVGSVIDEYLTLVARDRHLPPSIFQSLIEALPKSSRLYHDYLYRAIDVYLKAQPSLKEEEKTVICRAMEYEKLTQGARNHALRNDRLPLDIVVRFVLLEQVNMIRSITTTGSSYCRTKSQKIMQVEKSQMRRPNNCQIEIKMMKQDVETMKAQICQLQTCRTMLQRVPKTCTRV